LEAVNDDAPDAPDDGESNFTLDVIDDPFDTMAPLTTPQLVQLIMGSPIHLMPLPMIHQIPVMTSQTRLTPVAERTLSITWTVLMIVTILMKVLGTV